MRSMLFVPGNHPRRLAKALECRADAVIIDLEDAVPGPDKQVAREAAATVLDGSPAVPVFVRVNGFADPACYPDLLSVVRAGLAGVVLPKAERREEIVVLDWVITQLERQRGMPPGAVEVLPLVETARGAEVLPGLAAAPRVRRLSFGIADYSLDLGLLATPDEAALGYLRSRLVHCSRAAGIEPPLDSVVVEVRDAARFCDSARRARTLGMGGKLCIHPDQVELANEAFAPTETELRRARAIVEAYEAAQAAGKAAVTVAGEFVDAPVAGRARRLLALAGPAQQGPA